MSDVLRLIYWDACIFYEHLGDEQKDPLLKQAVDDALEHNKAKRNRICTSVITHLEVIPKKLDAAKEARYWAQFQSTFFFDVELDRNIIALGREIKDFYYKERNAQGEYRMMSSPDALHLATAIIHNVDEFYTRDQNSRHGNVKLLGLPEESPNGKLCGTYPLKVVNPRADQARLDGF